MSSALAMKTASLGGMDPLKALQAMNPSAEILRRMPATPIESARGAAGFPFVPQRLTLGNVMLIGDAAGYSEPFSGTGIGLAMHSARCAVRAILAGRDVAGAYARAMRSHRRAMWRTRMLSAALNSGMARGRLGCSVPRFESWFERLVKYVHVRSAI